ncbi:MAG TPA: radical SAM protein [Nitrospirota bacterium]|nr:radical SAM protein [Nitrospirota bacterium]
MLSDFLRSLRAPAFDWIQVEVTSFCNASCNYCPHTVFRDAWTSRHMTLETFKRLTPAFKKTKLVYLQGWGEPFLNPDFFRMAGIAKHAGCRVGTTTNGIVLDKDTIDRIIRTGLDVLTFSLAHTEPCSDFIRTGARLDMVLAKIRMTAAAKRLAGADKPAVHVAYLLLRSNREEVKKLPELLKGLGVDQVVISTLDLPLSPELEREAFFPRTEEEYEELQSVLEAVRIEGEHAGIPIHYQIGYAGRRRVLCSENIEEAVVIAANGDVHPCVFMNLSAPDAQPDRLTFGNINNQPLDDIWRTKAYRRFRKSFYQDRLSPRCLRCSKMFIT